MFLATDIAINGLLLHTEIKQPLIYRIHSLFGGDFNLEVWQFS